MKPNAAQEQHQILEEEITDVREVTDEISEEESACVSASLNDRDSDDESYIPEDRDLLTL
jgi:hypothetical protein